MPPKKSSSKAEAESQPQTSEPRDKSSAATDEPTKSDKKRKSTSDSSDQPSKAARRSSRGVKKAEPSQEQLLSFLLSPKAAELCRPADENEALKEKHDLRTYSSSALSPFEELVCAVILSRPISHRLGLRSIRTILNEPYRFTTANAIHDAGEEKRHQALWDAKTQHKGKTADQIGLVADVTLEKFTAEGDVDGTELLKLLDDSEDDIDKALSRLKENVKGLGKTGLDIFLRRVQWLWPSGYPFVDARSAQALKRLGLPGDAAGLQSALTTHWGKLLKNELAGNGEDAQKRRAFVVILDRVTGADLEGNEDALLEAAAASG